MSEIPPSSCSNALGSRARQRLQCDMIDDSATDPCCPRQCQWLPCLRLTLIERRNRSCTLVSLTILREKIFAVSLIKEDCFFLSLKKTAKRKCSGLTLMLLPLKVFCRKDNFDVACRYCSFFQVPYKIWVRHYVRIILIYPFQHSL